MPRVLNIGSLNIDYVYQVPHFLRCGETLAAKDRAVHIGGKGLNQSVALARAGLDVAHAGMVGVDGDFLKSFLANEGVDIKFVKVLDEDSSGHTVIQVTPEGENAILYYPGTNIRLTRNYIAQVLSNFQPGDVLLVQNETSAVADAIELGWKKGMRVIWNPSPFDGKKSSVCIDRLVALVLNETEAQGLLAAQGLQNCTSDRMDMVSKLAQRYPDLILLLTLGSKGVVFRLPGFEPQYLPAMTVQAVDTTGAGDTFLGYAVRSLMRMWEAQANGDDLPKQLAILLDGLRLANRAAAISVTKPGAAESIPLLQEVQSK